MPATPLFAANVQSPTVTRLVILSPPDGSFGASSLSKRDREVARSFLYAPSNIISYAPISMRAEQSGMEVMPPQPSFTSLYDQSLLSRSHFNTQLRFPPHTSVTPGCCDVIVDTVTDYDIFYPVAQHRERCVCHSVNDHLIDEQPSSIISIASMLPNPEENRRVDELAVSIDFPQDFDASPSSTNCYNYPMENSHYGRLLPTKNVRFDDRPTRIPYREKSDDDLVDHYYFDPAFTSDREQSADVPTHLASVQYKPTPFFWFRPVVDNNYAICIPRTRPSLHAYISTPFRMDNEVRF